MLIVRETLSPCQERLPAPAAQLNLPSGPVGLIRERRDRTAEDRTWHSKQLAVPHMNRIDKLIFERLAFYGSLNPERTAYPAVKRLAREAPCSERSARYALRRLETSGLIECVFPGRGRSTSRYRVGRCGSDLQTVPVRPANGAPKVLKEGIDHTNKDLSMNTSVKSIDPAPTQSPEKEVVLTSLSFPKQKQEKAKAPVTKEQEPKAPEPVFRNNPQVKLLFALQRKQGYEANDEQAHVFDGLEYDDRKRILDKLLAEEQIAAANGEVSAPPPKPRAPRFNPVSFAPKRAEPPSCVTGHRWSEAASDGIKNCTRCNAEQCATHRWTAPASDGVQNCVVCGAEQGAG